MAIAVKRALCAIALCAIALCAAPYAYGTAAPNGSIA